MRDVGAVRGMWELCEGCGSCVRGVGAMCGVWDYVRGVGAV